MRCFASAGAVPRLISLSGFMFLAASMAHADSSGYAWNGYHLGLNAGGAWTSTNTSMTLPFPGYTGTEAIAKQYSAAGSPSFNSGDFIGGVQAGYNMQTGKLVLGVEVDFNSYRTSESSVATTQPTGYVELTSTTSVGTDWLATVRGKLGFAFDRTLIYATGGLAIANLSYSQLNEFGTCCNEAVAESKTVGGWVLGGGAEYALDSHWSFKGEYLYADFDDLKTSKPLIAGYEPLLHSAGFSVSTVRAGINYNF